MKKTKVLKFILIISLVVIAVLIFLSFKRKAITEPVSSKIEIEEPEIEIQESETPKIQESEEPETTELEIEEIEEPEEAVPQEPETLHYVDAWDEWHDMVINPNVRKHPYNYEYLKNDKEIITYEGDDNYSIRKGVDVSHHQGHIDWEKVHAAGYEFAILRIGYRGYGKSGSLNKDKRFDENIVNAQGAGMDVGVYIFAQAINEEEALEEADACIKWLDGYELQLPVVYDPELIRDDEARTDDVSGEQFTKNAIVFCERIKEAGYTPMIYSNMVWEDELFSMEELEKYMFWYADYELIPQTPYDFVFWQLSEKGKVPGVDGGVDIDIEFIEK